MCKEERERSISFKEMRKELHVFACVTHISINDTFIISVCKVSRSSLRGYIEFLNKRIIKISCPHMWTRGKVNDMSSTCVQ